MKNLQKVSIALVLLFSVSLFAQRSTFWGGTYKMDYGNQTMKIESTGGQYYKAYFTGDCNARTVEGEGDGEVLVFPMVGGSRDDRIEISHQGSKIRVDVRGKYLMREACRGASIEGLYSIKKNNHYNSYNSYNDKHYNNSHNQNYSNSYGTTYIFRSSESGLVLDANLHSSDAVSVYQQHGGANQKWIVTKRGGDGVSIKNVGNGKCLTAGNSSKNGTFVSLKSCNNSNLQEWYLEKSSGRYYKIVSRVNSKVIDVNTKNRNLTTWSDNGSAHQKWILEKTY